MSEVSKKQYVFGLDIGTRSVVATVGYMKDDRFIVVCQRSKEHETRAMIDGQIHDIPELQLPLKKLKSSVKQ